MRRALAAIALACAGCASTSPNESFRDVSSTVETRTGHALYWNRGTPEDAQVDAAVDRTLASELGVEQAVAIALLNNRALTATYEERAQADVVEARERLTRLLGLWGRRAEFRVATRLPEMPSEDPSLEHLESTAIAQRLDLEAMRKEREAIGRTLSLVKSSRYTPGIDVGVNAARLNDGNVAIAPNVGLELPIFDQKQAVVARLEAMFRAADDRLRARAVEVRSDVRRSRERMQYARATVSRYRARVIPLRERVVALSQQRYDAMLLGVYQLLAAKQGEVNAYREAIEAARDYWLARVDLERTVAVRFPSPSAAAPQPAAPAPAAHDHSQMQMDHP